MSGGGSPDDALATALADVVRRTGAANGGVFLIEEAAAMLRPVALCGLPVEFTAPWQRLSLTAPPPGHRRDPAERARVGREPGRDGAPISPHRRGPALPLRPRRGPTDRGTPLLGRHRADAARRPRARGDTARQVLARTDRLLVDLDSDLLVACLYAKSTSAAVN
ncbi:hypothetical protein [Streptomyces sp. NPDC001435]|uniref:hypothetical protein n=1 Tax=unclassified Streptomyces TaxID=2593676 RepID=UPI0036C9B9F7